MGIALLAALPISAGEVVTLVNGHQMRADRVEFLGGTARLILGAGALEMPRAAIETIESFAEAAAPPAKIEQTVQAVAAAAVTPEPPAPPRNP